jgi:ADP-heptose:LPS heptosyltransferase
MRSLGLEVVDTKTDIFLTSDEIDWARNKMKTCGLEPEKKTILFHPSAAVPIREWPLERFGELIKKFTQKKNIQTIAICTEVEFPRIKPLLNYNPNLKIFHQMTLRQMMAVIHQCDLVVDNDSSPSHVATALGIPTIVLFSQAIREVFRPYHPDKDQHFVFHNNVHCRECELTSCDDRICLEFSPDEVYAKILETIDVPPKK